MKFFRKVNFRRLFIIKKFLSDTKYRLSYHHNLSDASIKYFLFYIARYMYLYIFLVYVSHFLHTRVFLCKFNNSNKLVTYKRHFSLLT